MTIGEPEYEEIAEEEAEAGPGLDILTFALLSLRFLTYRGRRGAAVGMPFDCLSPTDSALSLIEEDKEGEEGEEGVDGG